MEKVKIANQQLGTWVNPLKKYGSRQMGGLARSHVLRLEGDDAWKSEGPGEGS